MTKLTTIEVSPLLNEVKEANSVLNNKTQNLAVAESIILVFKDGTLTIKGTDGINYFTCKLDTDAQINNEFSLKRDLFVQTLNAVQLANSENDNVDLILEGDKLYLQSFDNNGDIVFNSFLNFFGVDDLPQFPETNLDETLTFDTEEIKSLFNKTFCYDKAGTREALRGVNIVKVGEELHLAATDGYRLSHVKTTNFDTNVSDLNVIVYPALISVVKKLTSEKVTFRFPASRDYIVVESGNRTLVFRLIQAQFPDVLRLFPKKHSQSLKITAGNMLKSINSVNHIATKNQNNLFKIAIKDKAKVSASHPDFSTVDSVIKNVAIGSDTEFTIALNNGFVKEALSSFDANDIINLDFEQKFLLLSKENDESFKHLVIGLKEQ